MSEIHREETGRARERRLLRLCRAAVVLVCLLGFARVHSYALVSDPAYYLGLGRDAADDLAAGRMPRTFIAPGFPLLLAGLRLAGGPHAPYFVNLLLWPACLLMLMSLLRRAGVRPAVAGLGGLLVPAWFGCRQDGLANYLLHPFREPAALFLTLAAFTLSTAAGRSAGRPLLAGFLLLLAAATREPFAALLPVLAAFHLARREGRQAGLVLAPAALGGLVLLALPSTRVLLGGGQAMLYLERMATAPPGPAPFLRSALGLADFLLWIGVPLVLAGVSRIRAHGGVPALLGLTGLTLMLVHAPVREHVRYTMVSAFFLLPLLVLGAERMRERFALPETPGAAVALGGLLLACLLPLRGLHPWGPSVSRDEVARLMGEIPSGPDVRGYALDAQARPLATLLRQFGRHPLLGLADARRNPSGVILLDSPTPEAQAYHGGRLVGTGSVSGELRHHHDAVTNGFARVRLGDAVFQPARLERRTATAWEISRPSNATARVVWLDLRSSHVPDGLRVDFGNGSERTTGPAGPGWTGIRVPDDAGARLRVVSDQPLPRDPGAVWREFDATAAFALDERRLRSGLAFTVREPVWPASDPFPASGIERIPLRLPLHFARPGERTELLAVLSARRKPAAEPVVSVAADGKSHAVRRRAAPPQYKQPLAFAVRAELPADARGIELVLTPPMEADNPVRVHELRIALLPAP